MSVSDQTTQLLELLQWPRVGPARVRDVFWGLREGESPLDAAERMMPAPPPKDREAAQQERDAILSRCHELGVSVVGLGDQTYPALLRSISDPPPVLYVRGSTEALSLPAIAVVGTREASEAGRRHAHTIARFLARRGYAVISGLALGIDTQAHLGALDGSGITVAVLAHGLHTTAPSSNRELADRIVAAGGALLAEHPPGVPPRRPEFVRRNRLQSGLSLGSIVVESGVEGGAIHQANFTKGQGRGLMTVLASSEETRGDLNEAGARHLVASAGAVPIRSTGDLTKALERLRATPVAPSVPPTLF